MKILQCIPHLSRGGAERQMCYLSNEMVRRGHEIYIAFCDEGPTPQDLKEKDIGTYKLNRWNNYDPRLFFQLVALIRNLKVHVVHTWIPQMDVVGGMAALWCGVPWVLRDAAVATHYLTGWKALLRKQMALAASAIAANSNAGYKYWSDRVRSDRIKSPSVVLIRNGIPRKQIETSDEHSESILATLNIQKGFVLSVGRLEPQKNWETLLHAIARVKTVEKVTMLICGEGSQKAKLMGLVEQLKLRDNVQFLGFQDASTVWCLMKHCGVLASISKFEGFPNVVLEGMAAGSPLIVSDIAAHREFLSEEHAEFVSSQSINEVANGIRTVLKGGKLIRRRQEIAKNWVMQWSVESMTTNYIELYKTISSKNAGANIASPSP
jgi:glycosyltransferase involved in cell wall biosynthesis